MSSHPRNTKPMLTSKRCGAKTRGGTPCQCPAVSGKDRCRMHGGASGSGAPVGNRNAYRHGDYSADALADRQNATRAFQELRAILNFAKKRD